MYGGACAGFIIFMYIDIDKDTDQDKDEDKERKRKIMKEMDIWKHG